MTEKKLDNRITLTNPTKYLMRMECPRCKDKYNKLIHYSQVRCQKCQLVFTPKPDNLQAHIVAHYAYAVLQRVSKFDETIIDCSTAYQHSLEEFRYYYLDQNCWDVSDIESFKKETIKRTCEVCGFCTVCVTCASCGTVYQQTKHVTRCPKCNSIKKKKAYIPEFKLVYKCKTCNTEMDSEKAALLLFRPDKKDAEGCENCKSKRVKVVQTCPHCGTEKVEKTIFKRKTKCPLCKEEKFTGRKTYDAVEFRIKRLPAFRK